MDHLIEDKREALGELCESFKVQRLELFGSAATCLKSVNRTRTVVYAEGDA